MTQIFFASPPVIWNSFGFDKNIWYILRNNKKLAVRAMTGAPMVIRYLDDFVVVESSS